MKDDEIDKQIKLSWSYNLAVNLLLPKKERQNVRVNKAN